jgi:hypothetical protein
VSDHRFNILSQVCIGCQLSASDLVDHPKLANACPAYYATLGDLRLTIRPNEELLIHDASGAPLLHLGQTLMFELRDRIEEGVRKLREAKGD